jgi:glycine betaine/proline transport system permease protein
MFDLFDLYIIPLDRWINQFVLPLIQDLRPFTQAMKWPVEQVLDGIRSGLNAVPPVLMVALITIVAWVLARPLVAMFTLVGLVFVGFLGIWVWTMDTLAMIITAVAFCAAVGIPVGVLAARSDRFEGLLRPILDAMQTVPAYAYLLPVVMLFSVGPPAATLGTIVFALPPIIRLTNLGIRQVPAEVVEAAFAFGSTPWQVLVEVQFPLALRTIMAGVNQTVLLAMSMVVIAALIGGGGLGGEVFRGLQRLNIGQGFVGSVGIVVLAIILDRITQSLGQPRPAPGRLQRGWRAARAGLFRRRPTATGGAPGAAAAAGGGEPRSPERPPEQMPGPG